MPSKPQSLIPNPALTAQVRRADEDRWLASRFAPADVRERLIALYALNDELARTREVVSTPALAEIRLAWWGEAIAEIYEGRRARAHPVIAAVAAAREGAGWPQPEIEALIDAWRRDFGRDAPESWAALDAYIDASAGRLMRLALQACGAEVDENVITSIARAWGYIAWARAGRPLPTGETHSALLDRAETSYAEARMHTRTLPASAFPALGYVSLIGGYIRTLRQGQRDRPLISRQLRLIAAAATGRL
jgi:phytoene/squalene synthetase